jgi:hypothetical protein
MAVAIASFAETPHGDGDDPMILAKACRINAENNRISYQSDSIYTWFSTNNKRLQIVTTSGHIKLIKAPRLISTTSAGLHFERCNLTGIANAGTGDVTVKKCKKIATVVFAGARAVCEESTIRKLVVSPRTGSKQKQVIKISNCTIGVIQFVNCKRFTASFSGGKEPLDFKYTSPDGLLKLILKNVRISQMVQTAAT